MTRTLYRCPCLYCPCNTHTLTHTHTTHTHTWDTHTHTQTHTHTHTYTHMTHLKQRSVKKSIIQCSCLCCLRKQKHANDADIWIACTDRACYQCCLQLSCVYVCMCVCVHACVRICVYVPVFIPFVCVCTSTTWNGKTQHVHQMHNPPQTYTNKHTHTNTRTRRHLGRFRCCCCCCCCCCACSLAGGRAERVNREASLGWGGGSVFLVFAAATRELFRSPCVCMCGYAYVRLSLCVHTCV